MLGGGLCGINFSETNNVRIRRARVFTLLTVKQYCDVLSFMHVSSVHAVLDEELKSNPWEVGTGPDGTT